MNEHEEITTLEFWKKSGMFSRGITQAAKPVKTKDMALIEDLNPESLPDSIVSEPWMSPVEKAQQLGADAMRKVVDLICCGVEFGNRPLVFIDLNPSTGDFLRSLLEVDNNSRCIALCPDDAHYEWLMYSLEVHAISQVESGILKIDGLSVVMKSLSLLVVVYV